MISLDIFNAKNKFMKIILFTPQTKQQTYKSHDYMSHQERKQ